MYCLSTKNCITVVKESNGQCKIYPGFLDKDNIPKSGYLHTNCTQYLTFYFSEDLRNQIVVRNQGNTKSENSYKIIEPFTTGFKFIDFNEQIQKTIYKVGFVKFNDVKENANYIDLIIEENYGTDKNGSKITYK